MTSDGVNTYTWDIANRLLSMGTSAYIYNGVGQRVQQTVSATVTKYLLDIQPGLEKVLQAITGANTTSYIHGLMSIHQQQNPSATWDWIVPDALGNVRGVVNNAAAVQESRWYDPYGTEIQQSGSLQTVFGFTGEETDSSKLVNLRARYYNPAIGQFFSLDPIEHLNRYQYVKANPINRSDPSGNISVGIWASAFIMPDTIIFPYIGSNDQFLCYSDGFNPQCVPLLLDIDTQAVWHGDGRDFYMGGDSYVNPPIRSARVWHEIGFDMDSPIQLGVPSSYYEFHGTGGSKVTYTDPNAGTPVVVVKLGQAPLPDPAIVSQLGNTVTAQIRALVGNPLEVVAPDISYNYNITLTVDKNENCSSGLINITYDIKGSHGVFPWQELYVEIGSHPIISINDSPSGPTHSPADLALPGKDVVLHGTVQLVKGLP